MAASIGQHWFFFQPGHCQQLLAYMLTEKLLFFFLSFLSLIFFPPGSVKPKHNTDNCRKGPASI
jgi:hypothetical protein